MGEGKNRAGEARNKREEENALRKKGRKVVLRIQVCWCDGHAKTVKKIVSQTVGVQSHSIDKKRSLVTVEGTMDVNALTETLKKEMKKDVEVIPDRAAVGENKKKLPAEVKNADQPKLEKDEKTGREQKKRENAKRSGRKEKKTPTPNEDKKKKKKKKKEGKGGCINLNFNITTNFNLFHIPTVCFDFGCTHGKGRRSVSPIVRTKKVA